MVQILKRNYTGVSGDEFHQDIIGIEYYTYARIILYILNINIMNMFIRYLTNV